jgi:2-polyprenyl-3-methyl-5-hydroxy-6-metoxy-1,4-benzoquinol methylase
MPKFLWNLYALCYDAIAGLAPYQDMLEEVVQGLELAPGMRVLDAGCGTGALAEHVARVCPGVELVGIDLSSTMLKIARARRTWPDGFSFAEAAIDDFLASDTRGFDRIASVNVIWTLPDPLSTFGRMTKALRPGGGMVHTTPRLRFGAQRIAWKHIVRQKGWSRLRAVASLPLLGLAGLLNLVLVAQSMLRRSARDAGKRWDAKGLEELLQRAGATVSVSRACYAGQGHLLVCAKDPDSSRLPVPPKGL